MNVQMFSSRLLTVGQRFSGLLLSRTYAKPAKKSVAGSKAKVGKAGPIVEKITFPAEKDTNKLVNYVCGSNIYVEGEDIKLKPESEYPEWLFTEIHIGPVQKLEELDPNTKAYWRRVRKMACRQNNRLELTKRRHLY